MKKIMMFMAIVMLYFLVDISAKAAEHPKPNDQQRLERRSGAYKNSLGQALNENPAESLCYYERAGCDESILSKDNSLIAQERPPKRFPQTGYLLGSDGLYHFKASALRRN